MSKFIEINSIHLVSIILISLLLIISRQVDELKITETKLIVYQRSVIPFLRSERVYNVNSIKSFKKNSRYTTGSGNILDNWIDKMLTTTSAIEILFENGKTEIIDGKVHKNGLKGLFSEMKKINGSQQYI